MGAKLYIPKPCHENWENMTHAQQGKHCSVCDKVVKDLTGLDKIQTLQIIGNSKENNICGRVNTQVLDTYQGKLKSFLVKTKHWGINILALIGLIGMGKKSAIAQINNSPADVGQKEEQTKFSNKKYTVKFRVKDELGDDISFARINIQGKGNKQFDALTDIDGSTGFILNEIELMGNEIKLTVSCMGFETKVLENYSIMKQDSTLQITLASKEVILSTYEVSDRSIHMVGLIAGAMVVETHCLGEHCGWITYGSNEDLTQTATPTPQEEPLTFKAYPVPTNGIFTLECNRANIFDVQIFDNTGKMLQTVFQINRRQEIDLSGYATGIYYARIMENGNLLDTKKVILAR